MTQLDTRLPCLTDGYYMYYLKSPVSGSKFLYIFELTGDDVHILRILIRNDEYKIYVKTPEWRSQRMMMNQDRTGVIFELTDEEYMLEISEEL